MQDVLQSDGQVGSAPGSGHTTWIQMIPVGVDGGRLMDSIAVTVVALNPRRQLTIKRGRRIMSGKRKKTEAVGRKERKGRKDAAAYDERKSDGVHVTQDYPNC